MRIQPARAKRLIDVAGASAGLIVGAIPMAVVALVIRIRLGKPVLFRQPRPGLHGQVFTLVKFRTMRAGPGPDAERLTKLGRALRSTSLDELPELWNVLRGDLSLVGPRPLLVDYLDRYDETQARRHEVRPGLTGLAQVSGRNLLSWEERFALDVAYVDTWTIRGDLAIIARTLARVVQRHGVSAEGHATMADFTGSAPTPDGEQPGRPPADRGPVPPS